MRRRSGSVGGRGGQPPRSTRPGFSGKNDELTPDFPLGCGEMGSARLSKLAGGVGSLVGM